MIEQGTRYGHFEVLKFDHREGKRGKNGQMRYRYFYECLCDCGNKFVTREDGIKSGHVRSCGCLQKETARSLKMKSGMSGTRFYCIWGNMKARCFNTTSFPEAHCYSLRGISMCDEWKDFQNFYNDMYPSYLKHVEEYGEKNTTIDRIDVDKSYCKENCKWSTLREQFNNKTDNHFVEYKGRRETVANWARELSVGYSALIARLRRGWTVERAFETPVIPKQKRKKGK